MSDVQKKYITEKIGEDYKEWKERDRILINGPTGSGKSYFIFHKLLKSVIKNKERILYLVNRKVLKSQLKNELTSKVAINLYPDCGMVDLNAYICIETYQTLERYVVDGDFRRLNDIVARCSMVVYDECHYFYNDSNFNTYTELSYCYLREAFENKIQVFMSATMENMKEYIQEFETRIMSKKYHEKIDPRLIWGKYYNFYEYRVEPRYEYVQMSVFESTDELIPLICESGISEEKWLIFTDSIEHGQNLEKILKETGKIKVNEVVFIDASYEKNTEANDSIQQLTQNKCTDKKIIIATAVMDNGVSFHDDKLRNLVLLCDTEEAFIQMLGRKREDEKPVKLYICKRDVGYFKRRCRYLEKVDSFYQEYQSKLDRMFVCRDFYDEEQKCVSAFYYWYYINRCINPNRRFEVFATQDVMGTQQLLLATILQKGFWSYRSAKALLYPLGGILCPNKFAAEKCRKLLIFYKDMIAALEKDENAFLKTQARWLGKDDNELENILRSRLEKNNEIFRQEIEEAIQRVIGQDLKSSTTAAEFKMSIKEQLIYFYKQGSEINESVVNGIKKNDRFISVEDFNQIMKIAQLPYNVKNSVRGKYIIERV